jgi:hypothetical protein
MRHDAPKYLGFQYGASKSFLSEFNPQTVPCASTVLAVWAGIVRWHWGELPDLNGIMNFTAIRYI